MYKVWVLAKNTLQEMIRERIFFVVSFIALALFALSFLLGALSFDEQRKILADFGFLALQVPMLGISIFAGAFLVAKEIEKQTCLLILSRPLSRNQFILGKMLGIILVNSLLMLGLGLVLALLLGLFSNFSYWGAFASICLSIWFESSVVLASVLTLSLIVRPLLALAGGIVINLLGHWIPDLSFFAEKSQEQVFVFSVRVLNWITPNFYRSNWKSAYYLDHGVTSSQILWLCIHMLGWMFLLILLMQFFFRRKDIV